MFLVDENLLEDVQKTSVSVDRPCLSNVDVFFLPQLENGCLLGAADAASIRTCLMANRNANVDGSPESWIPPLK